MRTFFAVLICLLALSLPGSASRPAAFAELPTAAAPVDRLVDPREGGLEVGMGEWAVTLEADAIRPGTVTFVIHNGGVRTHGFRIRARSERGRRGRRGRDRFRVRTERIPPGGDTKLTVNLPRGTYRVDCYVEEPGVGDHDDLGMRTTLTVREDAPLVAVRPAPSDSAVAIERFDFSPALLKVTAGTTVVWTNKDPMQHTVTAEDKSFHSAAMESGATFSRRFGAPGTFPYQCDIHPTMQGRVEVSP